jgi:hypothetical protein
MQSYIFLGFQSGCSETRLCSRYIILHLQLTMWVYVQVRLCVTRSTYYPKWHFYILNPGKDYRLSTGKETVLGSSSGKDRSCSSETKHDKMASRTKLFLSAIILQKQELKLRKQSWVRTVESPRSNASDTRPVFNIFTFLIRLLRRGESNMKTTLSIFSSSNSSNSLSFFHSLLQLKLYF